MPLLNAFIALLYLSLLLTTETSHAHDQRLSPLADSQFQAVSPQLFNHQQALNNAEPEPDEVDINCVDLQFLSPINPSTPNLSYSAPWIAFTSSPDTARAPPALLHI
ncbi:MAG: hypothetical protein NWQ54_19710 [Paraglaciecola sp.]|nr:hypothetical protein [Paraglaciecola sp.]